MISSVKMQFAQRQISVRVSKASKNFHLTDAYRIAKAAIWDGVSGLIFAIAIMDIIKTKLVSVCPRARKPV